MEELTAQVAQSRAQVEAASETAVQAAITAENEARSAKQYQSKAIERIVIRSAPSHRRYKRRGPYNRYREPYDYGYRKRHDRAKAHTYHIIYPLNHRRPLNHHRAHVHTLRTAIPRPIIPERSDIPKAYGIR